MPEKKRILFLTPRYPLPLIGGDRVKQFHLLKHLSSRHEVTMVTFYQGKGLKDEHRKTIDDMGIEQHIFPLNPLKKALSILFTFLGRRPLEILYYYGRGYQAKVDELTEREKFDLAFCFFMRTAEYVKDKKMKKVLVAEDCRTLYQYRSYRETSSAFQKMVRWWEWKKLEKYEPATIEKFDRVTLVTEEDIAAMKTLTASPEYRLLTNGTETERFVPPARSQRKGIIFAGKLDIWANELMVKKIISEILPAVLQKHPEAQLDIVGAAPPASIKALENENIKVTANVPDMVPYLQGAEVFIHPHSGGSGIQNKLLEAMSCGLPVVTTATGNQGISGIDGVHLFICNSSAQMAARINMLLSDKELAAEMGKKARELILEKNSWPTVYKQADSIINELCSD